MTPRKLFVRGEPRRLTVIPYDSWQTRPKLWSSAEAAFPTFLKLEGIDVDKPIRVPIGEEVLS